MKTILRNLKGFIGRSQAMVIADLLGGEEGEWFAEKMNEMALIIANMPKTYEQDGKGQDAIVSLHYFTGGCDWWITEKDIGEQRGHVDDEGRVTGYSEQRQAFGYADIGYGPELGYIDLTEILACGAELDLHFTPRPVKEVKQLKRDEVEA